MTSSNGIDSRRSIASIVKAMSIIEAFSVHRPELSAAELSALTGMDRTSIHRFVRTLVDIGQLEQSPSTRKYRLGLKVLDPAYALLDAMEIRSVAASHLLDFHARTYRWVAIGVPYELDMVIVERMWGGGEVSSVLQLGRKLPMATSSLGRSVLAGYGTDRRLAVLTATKARGHASLDVEQAMRELDTIAERNSALVDGGLWPNLRSVASAFFNATGQPVGAITTWNDVSLPIDADVQAELCQIASRISYSLGYRSPEVRSS